MSEAERPTGRRILLIEDDPALRQVLVDLLEDEGFVVRPTANFDQAQALMDREAVDLILSDLLGVGFNRVSMSQFHTFMARVRDTPVLLMSGWPASHDIDLTAYGLTEVIPKPFDIGDLLRRVHALGD